MVALLALGIAFILVAVGETGDKTQLAIIALAAQNIAPWEVFAGAVLAEVLTMSLGVPSGIS